MQDNSKKYLYIPYCSDYNRSATIGNDRHGTVNKNCETAYYKMELPCGFNQGHLDLLAKYVCNELNLKIAYPIWALNMDRIQNLIWNNHNNNYHNLDDAERRSLYLKYEKEYLSIINKGIESIFS